MTPPVLSGCGIEAPRDKGGSDEDPGKMLAHFPG